MPNLHITDTILGKPQYNVFTEALKHQTHCMLCSLFFTIYYAFPYMEAQKRVSAKIGYSCPIPKHVLIETLSLI